MQKIFKFGKIDFENTGKAINAVTVEINLRESKKGLVFTASGYVWNLPHTDILIGGQCLGELATFRKLRNNKTFKIIFEMWEKYHLNDMHAGTPEQENALKEAKEKGLNSNNYTLACEYLKSVGLYEVKHEGKPYKYGHSWLYSPIPADDLAKIKKLF